MEHKIRLAKKTVFIIFILSIQLLLLYAYHTQEDFFSNFKWEYLSQVYFPAYRYQAQNNLPLGSPASISESSASSPNEKAIPVLLYHGVVEREDGSNILVEDFRDQMMALKKAGYQTVSLDDFYKFVRGEKELPDKSFLLTFDDGRKDSYYPVDSILKALDYNAVMFVITRYIQAKNDNFYLSKRELQKMLDSGRWELQAHTKDGHDMIAISSSSQKGHYYTNKLWDPQKGLESEREFDKRVFDDLTGARNDLENNFGKRPYAFAFPFGDFGLNSINYPESKDKVLDITHYAYPISFYQITLGNGFMYNYYGDNDYLFKRINVRPEWTPNDLLAILETGRPKELPFEDDFSKFKGWFISSGALEMNNGTLSLEPSSDSSSATLFLEGSKPWKDYTFSALLDWNKGNKVSLVSRYEFISTYLACEISDQYIQLISEFAGKNELLSEIPIPEEKKPNRNNLEVTIKATGNKIECSVNKNLTVSYANVRDEQLSGGIGFRISNNELGNANLTIKKVQVIENSSKQNNPAIKPRNKLLNLLGINNFAFYNKE